MLFKLISRLNGSNRVIKEVKDALNQHAFDLTALTGNLQFQRARLRDQYGRFTLTTDKPVAYDSADHIAPWGTARDNSVEQRFNAKLTNWILPYDLRLLDLGCSGGGQVRSFIEQGCLAIGVEGSDFSMRQLRAEWATIPEFLFTADITSPFAIRRDGSSETFRFTVITLWEVIEHIHRDALPQVWQNIERHLAPGGVVIMSVSNISDVQGGVELHQTRESPEWWQAELERNGFRHHPDAKAYFGNDWVRWEANAPGSFHFVLTRSGEEPIGAERLARLVPAARNA
jgi:2-polyprenyl-3-methyl-5-hydroxy-6-metoxy-1,4-benzoquinol methylase